jgi:hypothetical protein
VLVPVVGVVAPAEALGEVRLAGAGVVTVLVIAAGLAPESPASFTSAAASTPTASTTTAARAAAGAPQLGDPAKRVRAAAPQCRHQSCSRCRAEPHTGHDSGAASAERGAWLEAGGGGAATLTC